MPLHNRSHNRWHNRFFTLLLACASLSAQAQVSAQDPWVRATVAQQKATGAFMQLTSTQDMRLVQVQSPVAGLAEVHEMTLQGDIMKMRAIGELALPAHRSVVLRPGSYHIMLLDLKQPLSAGDSVPLTLHFEGQGGQRQTLQLQAPVRALGAAPASAGHGGQHH
ncbi:copper chaperone PCu(A)C [Melaminivora sp.]